MDKNKEPELPPERFANLFRDAGINSPEALMRALRIGGGRPEPSVASPESSDGKKDGA